MLVSFQVFLEPKRCSAFIAYEAKVVLAVTMSSVRVKEFTFIQSGCCTDLSIPGVRNEYPQSEQQCLLSSLLAVVVEGAASIFALD
jgi:hypothetical protein